MTRQTSFWERRKAGVAAEAQAEEAAREAQEIAEAQALLDDKSDDEILAELDLPDPDSLKMGDDFTAFMSKAVPDRIRRRALRTLWRSNPVLANVDMLVDYGEDFTDKATVIENMQTAYQVGKGMLKHVEEMARQAAERENPTIEDDSEDEDELIEDEAPLLAADDIETPEPTIAYVDEDETPDSTPTPRRMKFRTEEHAA